MKSQYFLLNSVDGASYSLTPSAYAVLPNIDGTRTASELIGAQPETVGLTSELIEELIRVGFLFESKTENKQELTYAEHENTLFKNLTLHLTYRCNLRCQHCYVRQEFGKELSTAQLQDLIRESAKMGVHRIHFTGGEPFLRRDLRKLVRTVREEQVCLRSIFTNGMLVEQSAGIISEIADSFRTNFYISLDGIGSSHNWFRGSDSSFRKAISSIRFLQDWGFKVVINTILYNGNLGDIAELYEKLKSLRISRWRVDSPFPMGQWRNSRESLEAKTTDEIEVYKQILAMWERDGRPFELELDHLFKYMHGSLGEESYDSNSYVCCDLYRNGCTVWPNGDVSPCGLLYKGHIIGNVVEFPLSEIWESEKMRFYKELRVKDVLSNKCSVCKYLKECGTGCRGNSVFNGLSFDAPDPEICRLYTGRFAEIFEQIS